VTPLHPVFVHFSIALTAGAFAFDVAGASIGAEARVRYEPLPSERRSRAS
jgi:uncharacterized membrane protein